MLRTLKPVIKEELELYENIRKSNCDFDKTIKKELYNYDINKPEVEDGAGMDYNWWVCPACGEQIASNEDDALEFLTTRVLSKTYVK